jgi:hypothetical protein
MKYNLWQDKIRIGEVVTDKPLVKGDIVLAAWRVVDAGWQADARDPTNRVSSGDILVEPVNPCQQANHPGKPCSLVPCQNDKPTCMKVCEYAAYSGGKVICVPCKSFDALKHNAGPRRGQR